MKNPSAVAITETSKSDDEQRRQYLLDRGTRAEDYVGQGTPDEDYVGQAIWWLVCHKRCAEANAIIRRYARWFELGNPNGRDPQWEPDFVAINLCRVWHLFAATGDLEAETKTEIRHFFLTHDFASIYQSENHALLFHISRCLMAQAFPGDSFTGYGLTSAEILEGDQNWLKRFLRYRAECGWGEFDSVCYIVPVFECLFCLYDFTDDAELKSLSGMMLNVLFAEVALESINGMFGGAHGRIYQNHALDHYTEPAAPFYYLFFGGRKPDFLSREILDALTSSFRLYPQVRNVTLSQNQPYEIRERKQLHNVADVLPTTPLSGSIRKYSFRTPDYMMGCIQFQDAYPEGEVAHCPHHTGMPVPPDQRQTAGYAHHQQHEWDLTFATRGDARIFTHHPGPGVAHDYWTGDRLCGCGSFFQQKSALLALYAIPENQAYQYIHAYVPRAAFDEVVEKDGTIFIRSGNAVAALTLLMGYRWTREGEWKDREIISEGSRHAVVCEAGTLGEFGTFEQFQSHIAGNQIVFDRETMDLEYHSCRNGHMHLNVRGARQINLRDVDLEYPAYDSPVMQSAWKSGKVLVKSSTGDLCFDFHQAKVG